MEFDCLKVIEKRFIDYVEGFFGEDSFVNFNLHLKLCHSLKVRRESKYIVNGIGLDRDKANLAEAIGLLHDVGRFPQFIKYKTYKDVISIDHGELGANEIIKNGFLDGCSDLEKDIVDKAVRIHGAKDIPEDFTDDLLEQTQIIRDADKLDIFRVVVFGYRLYKYDPERYLYDLEYPENGEYTKKIYDMVMAGKSVDYRLLETMDDARLLQIAWVFDLNYDPSLKRLVEKGYLDELFSYLPQNREIEALRRMVSGYISNRLAKH